MKRTYVIKSLHDDTYFTGNDKDDESIYHYSHVYGGYSRAIHFDSKEEAIEYLHKAIVDGNCDDLTIIEVYNP